MADEQWWLADGVARRVWWVIAGSLLPWADDAQAGLAVLWVPYVAMPTAVVIGLAQAVTRVLPTPARAVTDRFDRPVRPR